MRHVIRPHLYLHFNTMPDSCIDADDYCDRGTAQDGPEIRLLIWESAMPQARVVFLDYKFVQTPRCGHMSFFERHVEASHETFNYGSAQGACVKFKSTSPPPALLYVCRESCEVTTKFYSRALGSKCCLGETWFDFEREILFPERCYTEGFYKLHNLNIDDRIKVRNLGVLDPLLLGSKDALQVGKDLLFTLSMCSNLKKLYLMQEFCPSNNARR
jgi:hypothetical protein